MASSKGKTPQKKVIIWAMDSTQNPKEATNILKEINTWAKRLDCDVQPVSVISRSTMNFPWDFTSPLEERFEDLAESSVRRYLKKTSSKGFLPTDLVFTTGISSHKMASELSAYAEKKKALMVFANTRAKKTWNPFRLGGFAETLAATCRIPVLLMNPSALPTERLDSILFATDFAQDSKNAILRLGLWAHAFQSRILLFNQVETPTLYPSDMSGTLGSTAYSLESLVKDIEVSRQKKAHQWAQLLEKENVLCVPLVQRQRNYLSAEVLEAASKHKAGVIALANRGGPFSQTVLGGASRDIILQAKCPVIIFHRPLPLKKSETSVESKSESKFIPAKKRNSQKRDDHPEALS